MNEIEKELPFKLLGLDCDNDSAFINGIMIRYCKERGITFTRTRPYKKNDNCYIEQKNWSVIRRGIGYIRIDTEEELKLLEELYKYYRLYVNYFQPVMKLKEKVREGSKVKKKYEEAKTPYIRILENGGVGKEEKKKLKKIYNKLNPAELKRKINEIQNKLIKLSSKRKRRFEKNENFEYSFNDATI
jgi:hypothetical protein